MCNTWCLRLECRGVRVPKYCATCEAQNAELRERKKKPLPTDYHAERDHSLAPGVTCAVNGCNTYFIPDVLTDVHLSEMLATVRENAPVLLDKVEDDLRRHGRLPAIAA